MEDTLQAQIFSRQLDEILAGRPAGEADGDLAKDLAAAELFAAIDLSHESRKREATKARLVRAPWKVRAKDAVLAFLKTKLARRLALAGGFCALFIAVMGVGLRLYVGPYFFDGLMMQSTAYITPDGPSVGWGFKPGAGGLGQGGSAFEGGLGGLAPGGPASNFEGRRRRGAKVGGFEMLKKQAAANVASGKLSAPAGRMQSGESLEFLRLKGEAAAADKLMAAQAEEFSREGYEYSEENKFKKVADEALSTFSIDVDNASYANVRRILNGGSVPPHGAVRIEEMINYFKYDYPEPTGEHPFSIVADQAVCPWNEKHVLARIALKGKSVATEDLPPANLVFLIDTSGSMSDEDKLPLLKQGFRLLVDKLREQDRVSIVAYAGSAGLVLPPTRGDKRAKILEALERLQSGGSTAGAAGITLAYQTARENFLKKGNNRVILATDGDFNVGLSSDDELVRLIEKERESGVFLSVLGFGQGNYQDAKMEKLADKGNGNFSYIDDISEADRVLVRQMGGTLFTIAKDVKIQVEFNPAKIQAYRLIGYENRMLAKEDFNDDKKDAGELGAGHTVTALYELIPAGVESEELPSVDPLKYQKTKAVEEKTSATDELLTVKFRYKKPDGAKSILMSQVMSGKPAAFAEASRDFRFAAAVAGFGMRLRESKYGADFGYDRIEKAARGGAGEDDERQEFVRLVKKAKLLSVERARSE